MLSIIIPAYNAEKTILNTLQSVVNQKTEFDFEIFVMDNCSADNTIEVAKKFLSNYDVNYKVIKNIRNLGLAGSINAGIKESNQKNNFVMILHSDIILKGEIWLNNAIKHFKDEKVGMVTGKYTIPNLNDFGLITRFCILKYFRQSKRDDGVYDVFFVEDKCNIFRREILREFPFSTDFFISGEDQDIAYRMKDAGYKVLYDSSLVYLVFLSDLQDSFRKILSKEVEFGATQLLLNLKHKKTLKKGRSKDSNFERRMVYRLTQIINVLLTLFLVILLSWYILLLVAAIRIIYSYNLYTKLNLTNYEGILFALFDYPTDFAYFLGVLKGGYFLLMHAILNKYKLYFSRHIHELY